MIINYLQFQALKNLLIKSPMVMLFAVLLNLTISAATITVTNTNDSGAGSLRQAISDSVSGDTVDFNLSGCPCTIVLTSAELLIDRKNLIINGPGANQLTVSGNNSRRIFRITGMMPSLVTISGVTIANGNTTQNGGGIYVQVGKLTLSNSVLSNNSAPTLNPQTGYGGAIMVDPNSSLNVINSTISNNSSARDGGAIATPPSNSGSVENITIVNSTISGNTARFGGGIFNTLTSTLTSVNSNYTDNTASGNGGGGGAIFNIGTAQLKTGTINSNDSTGSGGIGGGIENGGTLEFVKVILTANTSPDSGGGVDNSGVLTITDSTISGNTSINGGGINNSGTLNIYGSTFSANIISGSGGAINNSGTSNLSNSTISGNQGNGSSVGAGINNANNSSASLKSCTVAFNSSAFRGGGIVNGSSGATFTIGNTIIARNTAPDRGANGLGNFVSNGFNLIGSTGNSSEMLGFTNGVNGDIVGGSGPATIDPLLEPLADNGGQTQTHALQPASPAIDKGNTGFGITADQRGNARFIDTTAAINIPGGNNSDIGAFEFSAPTAAVAGISGKILTAQKRGIRNAQVLLIDGDGNIQRITTGTFGYYSFRNVAVGETYVLIVRSKSFNFSPQIITVNDNITDLNITASP